MSKRDDKNKIAKHELDAIAKSWLGKRGVAQTILEDYRGHDIKAEIQEMQLFLNESNGERLSY